ncbi:hypothetical protein D3C86_1488260 [compost metagenome]
MIPEGAVQSVSGRPRRQARLQLKPINGAALDVRRDKGELVLHRLSRMSEHRHRTGLAPADDAPAFESHGDHVHAGDFAKGHTERRRQIQTAPQGCELHDPSQNSFCSHSNIREILHKARMKFAKSAQLTMCNCKFTPTSDQEAA